MNSELILALDVDNPKDAKHFVDTLYPDVKTFKVGLQLFTIAGIEVIDYIHKKGAEVFLDLKFFDIPNTVANAVKSAVKLKVKMLTLHILGGDDMIKEAVFAAKGESKNLSIKKPLLIGVTILTSKTSSSSGVLALARTGIDNGLDGIVCSAKEAAYIKDEIKSKFIIVTPGIRPESSVPDDQKRTATPAEAVKAGSDFLVVGRPVLKAKDPLLTVKEILRQLSS